MAGLVALILLILIGYALLKAAEGVRSVVNRHVLGPEPASSDEIAALRCEVAALRQEVGYLRGVTLGVRPVVHDPDAGAAHGPLPS